VVLVARRRGELAQEKSPHLPRRVAGAPLPRVGEPLLDGQEDAVDVIVRVAGRQSAPDNLVDDAELHQHVVQGVHELGPVLRPAIGGVDVGPRYGRDLAQLDAVAEAEEHRGQAKVYARLKVRQHEQEREVEAGEEVALQVKQTRGTVWV